MSKTIDALGSLASKKHPNMHHIEMQNEIAKTYFRASTTPAKKNNKNMFKWKPKLPWFIAALAVIIALAAVGFRSNIDIKIRFLGEIPSMSLGKNVYHAENKGLSLIEGGEPNHDIVKNAYFSGDAKNFSSANPEEMVLYNSRGAGWANYTIELKEPLDLNQLDIIYAAKGSRGDEYLTLVIIDDNKGIYRLEKDISSSLGKDWRKYTINFRRVKKALDLANIIAIKFEFGSLTAGNYPNAVMFLKDIYVTKTRRLKWL